MEQFTWKEYSYHSDNEIAKEFTALQDVILLDEEYIPERYKSKFTYEEAHTTQKELFEECNRFYNNYEKRLSSHNFRQWVSIKKNKQFSNLVNKNLDKRTPSSERKKLFWISVSPFGFNATVKYTWKILSNNLQTWTYKYFGNLKTIPEHSYTVISQVSTETPSIFQNKYWNLSLFCSIKECELQEKKNNSEVWYYEEYILSEIEWMSHYLWYSDTKKFKVYIPFLKKPKKPEKPYILPKKEIKTPTKKRTNPVPIQKEQKKVENTSLEKTIDNQKKLKIKQLKKSLIGMMKWTENNWKIFFYKEEDSDKIYITKWQHKILFSKESYENYINSLQKDEFPTKEKYLSFCKEN